MVTDTEDPHIATLREVLDLDRIRVEEGRKYDAVLVDVATAKEALDALATTLSELTAERDELLLCAPSFETVHGPEDNDDVCTACGKSVDSGRHTAKDCVAWVRAIDGSVSAQVEEMLRADLTQKEARIAVVVDAWERHQRNDLSREEFEGTLHELSYQVDREAHPAPAPGELAEAIRHQAELEPCLMKMDIATDALVTVRRAAESWQRLQWRPASEAPRAERVLFLVEPNPGLPVVTIGERSSDRDIWLDEDTDSSGDRLEWQQSEVLGFIPLDALPALNGGDDEEAPFVCPGCHAVAPERCLPGCIDAEIEQKRQDALMSGDYADRDENGGDDNG